MLQERFNSKQTKPRQKYKKTDMTSPWFTTCCSTSEQTTLRPPTWTSRGFTRIRRASASMALGKVAENMTVWRSGRTLSTIRITWWRETQRFDYSRHSGFQKDNFTNGRLLNFTKSMNEWRSPTGSLPEAQNPCRTFCPLHPTRHMWPCASWWLDLNTPGQESTRTTHVHISKNWYKN